MSEILRQLVADDIHNGCLGNTKFLRQFIEDTVKTYPLKEIKRHCKQIYEDTPEEFLDEALKKEFEEKPL